MAQEDFKAAVKAFIELHDDIAASQRALKDLRARKNELAGVILEFMRQNEIDECALQDGKLIRKQTKRLEPLKKDHILEELKSALGPERAEAALVNIYSKRSLDLADSLRRTRNRAGSGT